MGVQFFLGEPSAHMKRWIINHKFWKQIVKNLETEPEQTKQDITSTDELVAGVLPSVGSTIPVDYKIDANGDAVSTEWIILGYNMSIPSRVKYLNKNNAIYVETTSAGLLASITTGTNVYLDKNFVVATGTVTSVGSETFTYGNNCTYSVPKSVTFDGVEYEFAGYNMTIQSRYMLATQDNETLYNNVTFDNPNKSNAWSTSTLRSWMNGSEVVPGQGWYNINQSESSTNIVGLCARLTDTNFIDAVIPTVNRTWVHPSWISGKTLDANQCEHVVDKFWLLGVGNLNCKGDNTTSNFPDGGASVDGQNIGYDTSRFPVFTENDVYDRNPSRIRNIMSVTGGDSSESYYWWGRSAHSVGMGSIIYVSYDGFVGQDGVQFYAGCLPVCLIG